MIKKFFKYQFIKYVLASAVSLFVDYLSYWIIFSVSNISLASSATIGYGTGLIISYFLIAGHVFKDGWLKKKKLLEIVLFIFSGMLGMIITYFTVLLYVYLLEEHVHISKLIAIFFSFILVYFFRKYVVFHKK